AGKPVIAYKLGRSEAGGGRAAPPPRAGPRPRGKVAGDFPPHPLTRGAHLHSLPAAAPPAPSPRPAAGAEGAGPAPTACRARCGAAVVADRLGLLGLELVPATDKLRERVAKFGIRVGHGPIVDVTAAGTSKEIYQAALEEIVASDCDAVVVIIGSSGINNPE